MASSFYDLDYIIEINEKRAAEYSAAYQKVQERLTNIILIYSGIAIYLVPIIQDLFQQEIRNYWLYAAFIAFIVLFGVSLFYTVRLIIPVEIADLDFPDKYYKTIRLAYELIDPVAPADDVDKLIKVSYVDELEKAVMNHYKVFVKKRSFYSSALAFGLASVIPYLICAGFHLTKKDDKVQKIHIVNSKITHTLDKKYTMGKIQITQNQPAETETFTTTTAGAMQLPGFKGMEDVKIIRSSPRYTKENSQHSSKKR